jgi:ribosomal RNA methyltransferase Nop2
VVAIVARANKTVSTVDEDDGEAVQAFQPIVDEDASEDGEDQPTFDDEEDAELIADSKRRALKAKGLNPKGVKPQNGGQREAPAKKARKV